MERQKEEARKAWKGRARRRPKPCGSSFGRSVGATEFLGYDTETAEGVVGALVKTARRSSR